MEEKLQILKMVEEGKITAEEAGKLLEAVEGSKEMVHLSSSENGTKEKAKWLRIRIKEEGDKSKVNINIPVSLVDIGMKIGSAYNKEIQEKLSGIDLNDVIQAIKEGAEGKIVDIETDKGEIVEIIVE